MLSSFSIISLIGVMLGVLVLVVVMAVYAGLARNVKERILGYSPHILLRAGNGMMDDWQETAKRAVTLPHVQAATPFIADNVIFDLEALQWPVFFTAFDTTDATQVRGIDGLLDKQNYPGSTADLGLENRVVISSVLAERFKEAGMEIHVGDKIRLFSTRNYQPVFRAFDTINNPPVRTAYADLWNPSREILLNGWKPDGEHFTLSLAQDRQAYAALDEIRNESIRKPEADLLTDILFAMDTAEMNEDAGVFRFDAASKATIANAIAKLETSDPDKMNGEMMKSLQSLILPKDAIIAGVYKASQMTVTPDLFTPLHLAQNLAGLEGSVQGISLRLDDPYLAEPVAEELRRILGPTATLQTWGEQNRAFFSLIEQQRSMMYFMLSFIILISAFSMMAVMFTVTIQKRREIGVMKALGAAPSQIVRVFLYQGMILGTAGAILGVLLGRAVIHFRGELQTVLRTFGFDPFTSNFTGSEVIPAFNNPVEQLTFAMMAFVLCSLAAFVPAWFAARSDAAKSLRNL